MKTLCLLKPDVIKRNLIGVLIARIELAGFAIAKLKKFRFDNKLAAQFYAVHKDKSFYPQLVDFMSSGDVVGIELVFTADPSLSVAKFRELIGSTNPAAAQVGTLRADYALSLTENSLHGSDSDDNAQQELSLIFS